MLAIRSLVRALAGSDWVVREHARIAIEAAGGAAISPLVEALESDDLWLHREAARVLSRIGDPRSVDALVKALRDEEFGVRWMAAEGLIAIGEASVLPLLQALIDEAGSVRLREGAHHVLHDLVRKGIQREALLPVLRALRSAEPAATGPTSAFRAYQRLTSRSAGPAS